MSRRLFIHVAFVCACERAVCMADPQLTKIKTIIDEAVSRSMTLPDETRKSAPIPVRGAKNLEIVFLFSPSRLSPKEGAFLSAPTHRMTLNAQTGKFEGLKAIKPADLGVADKPGQEIGLYQQPAGVTVDEAIARQNRLYELYDILLPPFAAQRANLSEEQRKFAVEFQKLFPQVTEPPLEKYYRTVGKEFFNWIDQAARQQ